MNLRILFYHEAVEIPYISEEFLEISENATIQELLQITEHGIVSDISDYYPLSGLYFYTAECLPFLFIDGKASYDVSFCDAKVVDFLNTHNITDNTIRITTDLPLAGGLGGPELLEAWNNIYPTLEQIAVLCTIAGFSIKSLFDLFVYLRKFFIKKDQPPQVCFDIVFLRKQWSSFELSTLLDIDSDKTKELLHLCNYQYDKVKMQYIQGEHAEEIKEKLMNIHYG